MAQRAAISQDMTKTFNCASCSAPLEFTGTAIQKCEHCGCTVIAPSEMFYGSRLAPFGDHSSLSGKELKISEIRRLIHDGRKLEAIKVFRETFGTGLKEAKDAVEAMERGDSVDVSVMRVPSGRQQLGVHEFKIDPEAVKGAAKKVGTGLVLTGLVVASFAIVTVSAVVYFLVRDPGSGIGEKETNSSPGAKSEKLVPAQEVHRFGGVGNGMGRFKDNRHVTVDGRGRVYSSDYSPFRIQVFDSDGKFLNQWRPEEGTNLYGLAADREGNLYVANDRGLFKFDGESGKPLAKADNFFPRGLTVSWDNKIVATSGKGINVYDTALKPTLEIRDAAERASSTFGFDTIAVDGDGVIYAKDRTAKQICKFSSEGRFLDRFELPAGSANAISFDPQGRLFITDTSHIYVVDAAGKPVFDFEARQAFGLAFDSDGFLYLSSRPYVVKYKIEK